jgi:hypothetical protein
MSPTRAIPLMALVVVGGCLAAGFVAEASALDQRIRGFIPVDGGAEPEVAQATGEVHNGSIATVHLALETGAGPADVGNLTVVGEDGRELAAELEPLRDEDGSLDEGRLDGSDLARLTVELASPMEGREERTLGIASPATETAVTLGAPASIDGGFDELAVR